MSEINLFFIGCVVIAILMLIESRLLIKNQGKFLGHGVLSLISLLEFLWLVLCVVVLFRLAFKGIQIIIPVVYILQSVIGWVYGILLFKKAGILEQLENDDTDIAIPRKFIDFTLSFSIVFLLASLWMLVQNNTHP